MADQSPPIPITAYRFGSFVLEPLQKRLVDARRRTVPLTPKAFDTLLCLVERSGELVSKQQLLERVWPHVVVEEAILARNVADLRKALGDDAAVPRFIETLPKRGYRFIAEVSIESGGVAHPAMPGVSAEERPVDTLQLVASNPMPRALGTTIDAPELRAHQRRRIPVRLWLVAAMALATLAAWLLWRRMNVS
jgi:DNA-binding winged helix-turn-helix (wHTH) protein